VETVPADFRPVFPLIADFGTILALRTAQGAGRLPFKAGAPPPARRCGGAVPEDRIAAKSGQRYGGGNG
jgi:hypothetical protein